MNALNLSSPIVLQNALLQISNLSLLFQLHSMLRKIRLMIVVIVLAHALLSEIVPASVVGLIC